MSLISSATAISTLFSPPRCSPSDNCSIAPEEGPPPTASNLTGPSLNTVHLGGAGIPALLLSPFPSRQPHCWCEGLLSTVIGKRWATRQDLSPLVGGGCRFSGNAACHSQP